MLVIFYFRAFTFIKDKMIYYRLTINFDFVVGNLYYRYFNCDYECDKILSGFRRSLIKA